MDYAGLVNIIKGDQHVVGDHYDLFVVQLNVVAVNDLFQISIFKLGDQVNCFHQAGV